MPDIERVIKGWECHMEADMLGCADCPYRQGWRTCNFADTLFKDVYALLKEQEPIPCGEKIKAGDVVLDFYECGYCKNAIRKPWRYCPFCGKVVKWDGSDRKTLV